MSQPAKVTKPKAAHTAPDTFERHGAELLLGDSSLARLAAVAGSTPFYAYDRSRIVERVTRLRAALPASLQLHYAMKANPMPAVVQLLAGLVDGLDVASANEMREALATGTNPQDISFAGPGKSDAELLAAVSAGIVLHVESDAELARAAQAGESLGTTPIVALRVNPDFQAKRSGMSMGGGAKPFGIDAERVPATLATIGSLGLDFAGFHIFSGSQNLDPASLIAAQNHSVELVLELADKAPASPRLINLGGGFGIPYFAGEKPLELAAIAENLALRMAALAQRFDRAEVILELGRYLVGEAGLYITRVIDRKHSRGTTYLVVDGGLHHHLAASGNFGQVIRKNYPVMAARDSEQEEREIVTIVGPLCTPLDVIADKVSMPILQPGDLVAVLQSGAYGYTASPHRFLSHPLPEQLLI